MKQELDWSLQWESFAENFYDGFAHIDMTKYGCPTKPHLILSPGPGFGDFSHPTTQLMLQMMKGRIEGCPVLDIGCGSGILSLSAILLRAKKAFGIDIDKNAILHAQTNAKANDLEDQVEFSEILPQDRPTNQVILMNMIVSEQRTVMKQRASFFNQSDLWILSGVLEEQLSHYLSELQKWGLDAIEIYHKEGWLGFICKKIKTSP